MDREEIEKEAYSIANIVCGEDNTEAWHSTKKGAIFMAEWMQRQITPLIDKMIEFYDVNDCEEIIEDISQYDNDYCERNCKGFCKECVNKWLKAKQTIKGR